MPTNQPAILATSRAIMGHCPRCGGVLIQTNEYGVWEPFMCPCGWAEWMDKAHPEIINMVRIERDFTVCTGTYGDIKYQVPPRRPAVETIDVSPEVL